MEQHVKAIVYQLMIIAGLLGGILGVLIVR